jgi:5-methylcytosine-specific restriction endonuclease McrA
MSWERDHAYRDRMRRALLVRGAVCWLCGGANPTQLDHVVPRREGGGDELSNLRPAHATCNYQRKNQRLSRRSQARRAY